MLWVDKYRPKSLDKLDYHVELTQRLQKISNSGDVPHLLFYGPSGAGKKTRVMALLRAIFGPGVSKVKQELRTFVTPTRRKIELTTLGSKYHIEVNPSDAGNSDRFVVQEVIKEIAQYNPLHAGSTPGKNFKVVFLSEADYLSKDAQHALRRTMEKYIGSCRIIMCCENLSKVIGPLRSRCLAIRVGAPTEAEVCGILTDVAKKEGISLPDRLASSISSHSKRNLRKALLMLETLRVQSKDMNPDEKLPVSDWEDYIAKLANLISSNQNTQTLLKARSMLYELLANCIPAATILTRLCDELMNKCDDELKHQVIIWAAHYEHRLQLGQKDIFHLEAFVAKFMVIYRQYILDAYL